jgi:hypothetical protein
MVDSKGVWAYHVEPYLLRSFSSTRFFFLLRRFSLLPRLFPLCSPVRSLHRPTGGPEKQGGDKEFRAQFFADSFCGLKYSVISIETFHKILGYVHVFME